MKRHSPKHTKFLEKLEELILKCGSKIKFIKAVNMDEKFTGQEYSHMDIDGEIIKRKRL